MHDELRDTVADACRRLAEHGLVEGAFGNVSGIAREAGILAIKRSGIRCDAVHRDDVSLVALETGEPLAGPRPSSDTPIHLQLYRAFDGIAGIAHTHSAWATAWAQSHRPLPPLGTTHADSFRSYVPCTRRLTEEECDDGYEVFTGRAIVEALRELDPFEMPAVLVSGHSPFTWGVSPAEAVEVAAALEQVARLAYATLMLNPLQPPISAALLDRHFLRKHGPAAYYGQMASAE